MMKGNLVSEPVPCPNCQTLLRLPAGATTVRCPNCKLTLEIDTDDEPAPPPPPAPPTAKAIPLPFGRAKPAPPPVAPPPPPVKPIRGKVVKTRVVAEDPYSATPNATPEPDDDEREREIRRKLKELEAEDRVKQEQFEELSEECRRAQIGSKLLGYACLCGVVMTMAPVLFIVGSLTATLLTPVLILIAIGILGHTIFTIAGFGYCISGPREMRGTAVLGLIFAVLHLISNTTATGLFVAPNLAMDSLNERDRVDTFLYSNLVVSNSMCNITVATDLPYYLSVTPLVPWIVFITLGVSAGFEFAKISCIGLLGNQYANAGKDIELSHVSMRFVYRIFAIVLVGPILKVLVVVFAPNAISWVPLMLGSAGFFLWMAFSWYMQYLAEFDIAEILTATRLSDKRRRIDTI
jgi:LSD1 subclass zinc finger protein